MNPRNETFTLGQLVWLQENYATCSRREAIETLGKKWTTITNRARILGLRRPRGAQGADKNLPPLRQMLEEGNTYAECASAIGVTPRQAEYMATQYGLSSNNRGRPVGVAPRETPEDEKCARWHDLDVVWFRKLVRYQHAWMGNYGEVP